MGITIYGGRGDNKNNASTRIAKNHSTATQKTARFVFAYPGAGVQHPGMGNSLYRTNSVFKAAIDECKEILDALGGFDITETFFSSKNNSALAELLKTPSRSSVSIFSYQYAMTRALIDNGIFSSIVLGHSQGEYSAAVAAGVLSLHDGLKLVHQRGLLLDSLKGSGAMVIVAASVQDICTLLLTSGTEVVAINGPQSTGIAGTTEQVDDLCKRLKDSGHSFQKIRFGSASHCYIVDPITERFESVLKTLSPMPSICEWHSTYKNELFSTGFIPDVSYWIGQQRNPVLFAQAVSSVHISYPQCIFIEIGPQNGLSGLINATIPHAHAVPLSAHVNDVRDADTVFSFAIDSIKSILNNNRHSPQELPPLKENLNNVEFIVTQVWMEALGCRAVRLSDNFFEVGGHSILAARFAFDLSEMFGLLLPANLVVKNPTVSALSLSLIEHCVKANIDANIVAKIWRMAYEQTENKLEEAVSVSCPIY